MHLEAVLEARHPLAQRDPERQGHLIALEVRVVRVHVDDSIRLAGHPDRIDPERWRPLITEIPESAYRPPSRAPEDSRRENAA